MRVEIYDCNGQVYGITSRDLDLIGRWFAEMAPLMMSDNTRINHPAPLHIWPQDQEESKLIPDWQTRDRRFTADEILALAEHLTKISASYPAPEARYADR